MFRIVLQPEERAVLLAIKAGTYRANRATEPIVARLAAMKLLEHDEHGGLALTPLAEAALARVAKGLH
jgi:hypothetical protein